jgi:hypothetical protein
MTCFELGSARLNGFGEEVGSGARSESRRDVGRERGGMLGPQSRAKHGTHVIEDRRNSPSGRSEIPRRAFRGLPLVDPGHPQWHTQRIEEG